MEDIYPKAYKEVYVILKHLSKNVLFKIPTEVIADVKNKMDKDYDFQLNEDENFFEQNILDETKAILAVLYKKYWESPEEKETNMVDKSYNIDNAEQENIELYNTEEICESCENNIEENNIIEDEENDIEKANVEETNVVVYKESIFRKIINMIKKWFNRNR